MSYEVPVGTMDVRNLMRLKKNNDFEGLVRKYCSRSLTDKSQQGTLGIYIFFFFNTNRGSGLLTSLKWQ